MGFFYLPNYISEPGIPKSIYIYICGRASSYRNILPARLFFFFFAVLQGKVKKAS